MDMISICLNEVVVRRQRSIPVNVPEDQINVKICKSSLNETISFKRETILSNTFK